MFWNEFEQYWFSITKERICLTKRDIIVGIITRSCPLLNYLLIIAELYVWEGVFKTRNGEMVLKITTKVLEYNHSDKRNIPY